MMLLTSEILDMFNSTHYFDFFTDNYLFSVFVEYIYSQTIRRIIKNFIRLYYKFNSIYVSMFILEVSATTRFTCTFNSWWLKYVSYLYFNCIITVIAYPSSNLDKLI